jgi:hypothetical protein
MRADDVAARRAGGAQGRRTLLAALLAMGTGVAAAQAPAPAPALAATGGVVAARAWRLAEPAPTGRWLCHGLALAALTLAVAIGSALVLAIAIG